MENKFVSIVLTLFKRKTKARIRNQDFFNPFASVVTEYQEAFEKARLADAEENAEEGSAEGLPD